MEQGNFYTVSTPIGNLDDISKRAISCLESVDIVACEDTRVSKILFSNLNLQKKVMVYQKFNENESTEKIINYLKEGKNIALISDAGTPCISDPGKRIVKKLYENGIKTTNIPGACAITTLLASAPKDDEQFVFYGFLPRTKNEQQKVFDEFFKTDLVFYESPKRLLETLENILLSRGEEQKITIGRELTKKFEEIKYDNIKSIINYYKENTLKGEIAAILYKKENFEQKNYEKEIKLLLEKKYSPKDISIILSTLYEYNKKEVYSLAVEMKNKLSM